MSELLPSEIERFARSLGPEPDDVLQEMDAKAEEEGFPTVGPEVGGWLELLARIVEAERVFEFGSGFGYSAYWLARALPEDGEVILTEIDVDELDEARTYFERGGYTQKARFEQGDAIDIIGDIEGTFDIVLIDNEKDRYVEAFEAARDSIIDGGLVIADNAMTAGIIDFDALLAYREGGEPEMDEHTRGIAEYLDHIEQDEAFETALLPLGEGVAVSVHLPNER